MRGRSYWLIVLKWKFFQIQQRRGDRTCFQYVCNFCKARGRTGNHLQVVQPMWETACYISVASFNGLGTFSAMWYSACLCNEGTDLACDSSRCMFLTLKGRSTRRVFPHPTPSSCSSACCPTHPLNLLISGRLQTKTTTPRSGSPSTVSLPSCFGPQLEGEAAVADPTYTQLHALY